MKPVILVLTRETDRQPTWLATDAIISRILVTDSSVGFIRGEAKCELPGKPNVALAHRQAWKQIVGAQLPEATVVTISGDSLHWQDISLEMAKLLILYSDPIRFEPNELVRRVREFIGGEPAGVELANPASRAPPAELQNIFILSIRAERKAALHKRLGLWNQYVREIDCVHGSDLNFGQMVDEAKYDDAYFLNLRKPFHTNWRKRSMTRGELGCVGSHRAAWQAILDRGMEHGLILEDDVVLFDSESTVRVIERAWADIKRAGATWDVMFLGRNRGTLRYIAQVAPGVVIPFRPDGAFAYIVNRRAAKLLLQHSDPIRLPADTLIGALSEHVNSIKMLALHPPLVDIVDYTDSDTTAIV